MMMRRLLLILIPELCFFSDAIGLWSSTPAAYSDIMQEAYPIGNGKLGGSHLDIISPFSY